MIIGKKIQERFLELRFEEEIKRILVKMLGVVPSKRAKGWA